MRISTNRRETVAIKPLNGQFSIPKTTTANSNYNGNRFQKILSFSFTFILLLLSFQSLQSQCNCTLGCTINPDLNVDCEGLDIILVLDESGSIFNAGVEQDVEQGVMNFVNALNGTPVQLAIVDFSTTSSIVAAYSTVDQNYIDNFIFPYLTHDDTPVMGYSGETYNSVMINSTNWEAALQDVQSIGGADLVIFFTDGNPTAPNGSGNQQQNLDDACDEANIIKALGTHIFMLGIGNVEADNLQSISGADAYNGSNIQTADYSLTSDFSQLGSLLAGIVDETCGNGNGGEEPILEIQKSISPCVDGQVNFTITISNTGDVTATEVSVTDNLQSGYSYDDANASMGTIIPIANMITWLPGNLAPNTSETLTIIADVNPVGDYSNTATIDASNANGNSTTINPGMPNCCEFSATCNLDDSPQQIEGCTAADVPPPTMNMNEVFTDITQNPCGELIMTSNDEVMGTLCPDGITITRIYTLFDDTNENGMLDNDEEVSEKFETCEEVFIIRDTQGPDIEMPDPIDDIECDDSFPTPQTLTATDDCDGDVLVNFSIDPYFEDVCNGYTVTYRWEAEDNCGNPNQVSTSFFVRPAQAPMIDCPIAPPIICTDAATYLPIPAFYTNNQMGNCEISGFLEGEVIEENYAGCGGILRVRYEWINPCDEQVDPSFGGGGNVVQVCEIQVLPAPVPEIICPNISPISCEDVATFVPPMATYTNGLGDDCLLEGAVSGTFFPMSEGACLTNLVITYQGFDNCERALSPRNCFVDVFDNLHPDIICPAPITLPCDGELPSPHLPSVSVLDNCSSLDNIDIEYVGDESNGGLNCPESPLEITRTYRATDACGNVANCSQLISFEPDDEGPVWGHCIETIAIDCETEINANFNAPILLDDPCAGPTTQFSNVEIFGTPGCPGTQYIYTYTAIDACGREAVCTQVYTINEQDFSIECPDDFAVECTDPEREAKIAAWLASAGESIETPCGDEVFISHNYHPNGFDGNCGGPNAGSQIVTFSVIDECGRFASCEAIIEIIDTEPPILLREATDKMAPCGDGLPFVFQAWLDDHATANASDACGIVTWSTIPETPSLDGLNPVTVTFVASDGCGNIVTTNATFFPIDDTPPILITPAQDIVLECDDEVDLILADWLANHGFAEAMDLCGEVTWSIAGNPQLEFRCDGGAYPLYVDFIAEDEAGNQIITRGIFNVNDNTPPIFTFVPEEITIDCDANVLDNFFEFGEPEAVDNCSNVTITHIDETIDGGCGFHIIRTWTAMDACGNSSTASQTVQVVDNEAPELIFIHPDLVGLEDGDEVHFNCDDDFIFNISDVEAIDNCSEVEVTILDYTLLEGNCSEDGFYRQIVCTWTGVDRCGNLTDLTITMIITDDEAPVFTTIPEDMTLGCTTVPPLTPAEAIDNCTEEVTIEFVDEPYEVDCQNGFTIHRTWIATDDCGNVATTPQIFTIEASQGPIFNLFAATVNVGCGEMEELEQPTCISYCGDYTLTYEDEWMTNDCTEEGTILRTWTATDQCNIYSQATQTIIMEADDTPPVIAGFAEQKFILCGEAPVFDEATATDNCEEAALTFEDEIFEDGCEDVYTRIWTATDACGNTSIKSQIIQREPDTTPPYFFNIPDENITVNCGEDAELLMPGVGDNCAVDRFWKEDEIIEGDCSDFYIIERSWTAVDLCGNARSVQRQLVVEIDNTAPIFLEIPENKTIACGEEVIFGVPEIIDYCSETGLVVEDQTHFSSCGVQGMTRTWIATDACGNTNSASQTIEIEEDATPPIMEQVADYDVSCEEVDDVITIPQTTDNCGEVEVTYEDEISGGDCNNGYTIVRTWTATDLCGNSVSQVQLIHVFDGEGLTDDGEELGSGNSDEDNTENTVSATVDIEKISLHLYPNPVQQTLFLELENTIQDEAILQIFDLNGKLIKSEKRSILQYPLSIDVADFKPGLYVLTMTSGKAIIHAKFMKF